MSGNENKTLKQLLTEPYRVQKKKGYYSYDAFRQDVMNTVNFCTPLLYLQSIDSCLDSIERVCQRFHDEKDHLGARRTLGLQSAISFLGNQTKKIAYLDNELMDVLEQTIPPGSFCVKTFKWHDILLLLPKGKKYKYILFAHLLSDVVGVNIFERNEQNQSLFFPFFLGAITIGKDTKEANTNIFPLALIINLLLWQQSMHNKGEEVIEVDTPTQKKGFSKNTKQIIVPRVIGEGYKPKVIRNYEPTGTHASPRTHWRSGHWRQQPIGKRDNPEHKTIWIEPILINP